VSGFGGGSHTNGSQFIDLTAVKFNSNVHSKRLGAKDGIDLPNIAFGAQTTLAHSRNGADSGGTLTVTDGRHAAAIALLGNCMAGSFVAAAGGHGGTLVTETLQAHQPPPLSHPRA
jgi:hypothetical protein